MVYKRWSAYSTALVNCCRFQLLFQNDERQIIAQGRPNLSSIGKGLNLARSFVSTADVSVIDNIQYVTIEWASSVYFIA